MNLEFCIFEVCEIGLMSMILLGAVIWNFVFWGK